MVGREVIWYRTGNPSHDDRVASLLEKARAHRVNFGTTVPSEVRDVSAQLAEMRLLKTDDELASLRRARDLSVRGHAEAMRFARPGRLRIPGSSRPRVLLAGRGSRSNGYSSIVASGANACVLHYVENERLIEDGDLVLIDAAAEVEGYSSDITRTFPANGSFTAPQRALYELVLSAQRKGLELSAPGSSQRSIHDAATRVLTEGMVELGLLPRSVEELAGDASLQPVLLPRHGALAGAGRARRRHLPGRRRAPQAGARNGLHRRAGHLHRSGQGRDRAHHARVRP